MSVSDAAERSGPQSRGAPPSSQTVPISSGAVSFRGELAALVQERLVKALGGKRAGEIMRDTIAALGGRTLDTPQDMMDFGDVLVRSTGLLQAVGRSIKVMALLRGAAER